MVFAVCTLMVCRAGSGHYTSYVTHDGTLSAASVLWVISAQVVKSQYFTQG